MDPRQRVDIKGTYRNHGSLFPDARQGLGYGLATPSGRFEPRQMASQFPYLEPDLYDDMDDYREDDDDLDAFVSKINQNYRPSDSLAANSVDRFYFVGGNTTGLTETGIAVNARSISPIPQAYKQRGPSLTGYGAAFPYPGGGGTSAKKTGTLQGYFHRPPQADVPGKNLEIGAYRLQDLLDDDELAYFKSLLTQKKINHLSAVEEDLAGG